MKAAITRHASMNARASITRPAPSTMGIAVRNPWGKKFQLTYLLEYDLAEFYKKNLLIKMIFYFLKILDLRN